MCENNFLEPFREIGFPKAVSSFRYKDWDAQHVGSSFFNPM